MLSLRAVVLVAVLAAPVAAAPASVYERHVEGVVGSPTPLGATRLLSDEARFLLDVPKDVTVFVDAVGTPTAPFYLRFHREGAGAPDLQAPSSRASLLLPGPARWVVAVDPAVGVDVDVRLRFEGHVVDVGGAAAAFVLEDAGRDRACVVPGVCLP